MTFKFMFNIFNINLNKHKNYYSLYLVVPTEQFSIRKKNLIFLISGVTYDFMKALRGSNEKKGKTYTVFPR